VVIAIASSGNLTVGGSQISSCMRVEVTDSIVRACMTFGLSWIMTVNLKFESSGLN
jgi:hypothetical protein